MADDGSSNISPSRDGDRMNAAADAALRLARDGEWGSVSLREIALAAATPFVDLYAEARDKGAVVDRISRRLDEAALKVDLERNAEVGDRLFEATMARLEAMEPERFALIAMAREEGRFAPRMAMRLAATAKALLEAAGVDTSGTTGTVRVAAMTQIWIRVLQVWRDDEGALNRTMAEIDKQVKQLRRRLGRIGLGF